jgi:hypothetical protein
LRDGIAHAFFPENLRSAQPTWKGKNGFSLDGITAFVEDIAEKADFFIGKLFAGN